MQIEPIFKRVDYRDEQDSRNLVDALNQYAMDPMGGGQALSEYAQKNLAQSLAAIPHAVSILMFVGDEVAGFSNCFEGFSTFACKKLLNIHDFAVLPQFRGKQLSQKLLAAIEEEAKLRGCCKLTLEVLEGNEVAKKAYQKFGFESYELDSETGHALFLAKVFTD